MAAGGDFPRSLAHESGPAGLTGYFAVIVIFHSPLVISPKHPNEEELSYHF